MASSAGKGRAPRIKPSAIDEEYKIQISKRINAFRESDEQVLVFPKGLDNQERKYVHELCLKLGLLSKSTGSGDSRYLTVRKPIENAVLNENLPFVQLFPAAQTELAQYFDTQPIKDDELNYVLGRASKPYVDNIARTGKNPVRKAPCQTPQTIQPSVPPVAPSRTHLPTWGHRDRIIQCIRDNVVTIVSGETGSGKSTQTVQYVLDAFPGSKILCTQPRRLSAIALAERVAEERGRVVGKEIGYSVRFETELTPGETRCIFCTTGVALSALRDGLSEASLFHGVTHLFIDEVHERDRNTDFLLIFVKELLLAQSRPDWNGTRMRIVLMSATINVQTFYNYFAETGVHCATVAVEGSTFKVQPFFLEETLEWCKDFADKFSNTGHMANGGNADQLLFQRGETAHGKVRCPLCGWGAKSVEEFGTHAATCQGELGVSKKNDKEKKKTAVSENDAWEDAFGQGPAPLNDSKVEWEDVWGEPAPASPAIETVVEDQPGSGHESSEDEGDVLSNGVFFDNAAKKWRAVIVLEGQEIDLGAFETREHAEEMFLRALGKWSSSKGDDTPILDEEETPRITPDADGEALLSAYLRSRAGDDELEVDNDLVVAVLEEIVSHELPYFYADAPKVGDDGASAILIFLPGWSEISTLCDTLSNHPRFGNDRKYMVLPLHSGIPSKEQKRVFARPPSGVRKIICATNIAETSLTIEDVVYVIDCGLVKEKGYDSFTRSSSLLPHFVSKASARQRRGRAGRCRPGVCFHLYSRRRFETMLDNQVPELLRTPLEEMCIHAKAITSRSSSASSQNIFAQDMSVADFLLKALDPPSLKSILAAVQSLTALGAMDDDERLTSLGMRLCAFPLEPRVAKTLLYGSFFGTPVPAVSLAVASGARDPFVIVSNPALRARAAQTRFKFASSTPQLGPSDHIATLSCVKQFLSLRAAQDTVDIRKWCSDNFLSFSSLESLVSMQRQVSHSLFRWEREPGHAPPPSLAFVVLSSLICLVTSPNLAILRGDKFACSSHRRIRPHQSSAISIHRKGKDLTGGKERSVPDKFLVFEELCRNAHGCTLRVLTEVNPLVVVLFGGNLNLFDPTDADGFCLTGDTNSEFRLNSWARVKCNSQTDAIRLAVLRLRLESQLMAVYQRGRYSPEDRALSSAIIRILSAQVLDKRVEMPLLSSPGQTLQPQAHSGHGRLVKAKVKSCNYTQATVSPFDSDKKRAEGKRTPVPASVGKHHQAGNGDENPAPKAKSAPHSHQGKQSNVQPRKDEGVSANLHPKKAKGKPNKRGAKELPAAELTCIYCEGKGHTYDSGCTEFAALPEAQQRVFREIASSNTAV